MSLPEAITAIIERIEKEAEDMEDGKYVHERQARKAMQSFANELKVAVEAVKGIVSTPSLNFPTPVDAAAYHRRMIDEARLEMRKAKGLSTENISAINLEESHSPKFVQAIGGKSDGCSIPLDPNFRAGAETSPIAGDIYQLGEDGYLHFIREQATIIPGKS